MGKAGTSLPMELIISGLWLYLNLTIRRFSCEIGLYNRSPHLSRTMLNTGSPQHLHVGYTSLLINKINGWRCNLDSILIISPVLNDYILIQLENESTK